MTNNLAMGVGMMSKAVSAACSAFLSLLVIPAVFTIVDDVPLLFGRLFRRVGGQNKNLPMAEVSG